MWTSVRPCHAAEHHVLTVQPVGVTRAQEELAPVGQGLALLHLFSSTLALSVGSAGSHQSDSGQSGSG
jgi:hypothetical protein